MSIWKSLPDSIAKLLILGTTAQAKNLKNLETQLQLQKKALKLLPMADGDSASAMIVTPALIGGAVRAEIVELAKASGQDPLWVLKTYLTAEGEATFSWDPVRKCLKAIPQGLRTESIDFQKARERASNWSAATALFMIFLAYFEFLGIASGLVFGFKPQGIAVLLMGGLLVVWLPLLFGIHYRDERRFKAAAALEDAGILSLSAGPSNPVDPAEASAPLEVSHVAQGEISTLPPFPQPQVHLPFSWSDHYSAASQNL
jgi:hypothetical protein